MSILRKMGPVGLVLALTRAAMATREHWQEIPTQDRWRLRTLMRKSRGRPSNLSQEEQSELLGLTRSLKPLRLAWRLVRAAILPGRSRGRKKR